MAARLGCPDRHPQRAGVRRLLLSWFGIAIDVAFKSPPACDVEKGGSSTMSKLNSLATILLWFSLTNGCVQGAVPSASTSDRTEPCRMDLPGDIAFKCTAGQVCGTPNLAFELRSPAGGAVCPNEFVLDGCVTYDSLLSATLSIQGSPPSSRPFRRINLIDGELGRVLPAGAVTNYHFRLPVRGKLFQEYRQSLFYAPPYTNKVVVDVANVHGTVGFESYIINYA